MDEENWIIIKHLLCAELRNSSEQLDELLKCDFSTLQNLPEYDGSRSGKLIRPLFQLKRVEADYIEFLDEQISLNARGDNWTKVLKERRDAVRPYIGKELMVVTFYSQEGSLTARIDMNTKQLVYVEGR